MIGSSLFRKHFAIAALTVLAFIFVGAQISVFFMEKFIGKPRMQPPVFFARLVEELDSHDPINGLKKVEALSAGESSPFSFSLYDENGERIYGNAKFHLNKEELPKVIEKSASLSKEKESQSSASRPNFFRGSIFKLKYDPPRYLVLEINTQHRPPPPSRLFPPAFLMLVFTVLVGIAFALFIIFRSLRDQVKTADFVISELQRGNLKARFPVIKNDEIGKAMERFNRMADEIEKLVERLHTAERSRNQLLQELAHDLRTPVASLKNLTETIFSTMSLSSEAKDLPDLVLKEIDYIGRLVEDLLLLAQVSEIKYRKPKQPVDLLALLHEEGDALQVRYGGKVRFRFENSLPEFLYTGEEQLMRRLFRNALENAFSFAASEVEVNLKKSDKSINIVVSDDGQGFDEASLARFGERRMQRSLQKNRGERLSLGLGSVIMKTVVELHGGTLKASNKAPRGALINVELPLSK